MPNAFQNPGHSATCKLTKEELQKHFDEFYEDFFVELAKYGEVEEMNVCDNVGDHLNGSNLYLYEMEILTCV